MGEEDTEPIFFNSGLDGVPNKGAFGSGELFDVFGFELLEEVLV